MKIKRLILVYLILPLVIVIGGIFSIAWLFPVDKNQASHVRKDPWPELIEQYAGEPEYKTLDFGKPVKDQKSEVRIAGRTFLIPKVHIDSHLGGKKEIDGLNLNFIWPDLTSYADFKNKQEYERAFNEHRLGHMLIKDAAKQVRIENVIENRKKNEQLTKYLGLEYGLHRWVDFDSSLHLNIKFDDTYLEITKDGKIVSYLSCSPDGEDKVPGCSHIFEDKGILYDVHYSKENYLKNWQEMRHKAIAFVDRFEA